MFNFSVGSSRRRKDKGRSKTLPNNVFDLKLFKPSNSPSEQMVSQVLCAELIAAPDHKPVIFIFFLCFFLPCTGVWLLFIGLMLNMFVLWHF